MEFVAKNVLIISVIALGVTSCAHHPDVRPGVGGVNKVVITGANKKFVTQNAVDQSRSYCKDKKKSAVFISESTRYTGSMNENTHKTLGKVSKAVTAVGGVLGMSSTSTNQMKDAGVVMASGSAAGGVLQDEEAYTTTITFKCE